MIGERFGKLVILEMLPRSQLAVRCDCGKEKIVAKHNVKNGSTRSCGCVRDQKTIERSTKHGNAKRSNHSLTYKAWLAMLTRIDYPEEWKAKYYRDKGITVCDRWREFANFLADMGERPSKGHSIERGDNSKGYEPSNCRWATKAEQARNTSRNVIVEYCGRKMCLKEAVDLAGVPYARAQSRLSRGLSVEEALAP